MIIFGGHYIIGLIWGGGGSFLDILGLFLKARCRIEIFSGVIYLGMPDIFMQKN